MKRTLFAVPVLLVGCWLLSSFLLPVPAFSEPIPTLRSVPDSLPPAVKAQLSGERKSLDQELQTFLTDAKRFNDLPAEEQTDDEYAALGERRADYITKAEAFNQKVDEAASSNVVDLSDINNPDQGLMKNQWKMSIDWRYRNDPEVRKYMNDLWADAFSSDSSKAQEAENKLERILKDQMLAEGRSPQEVDEFFGKVKTFLTGEEDVPKKWENTSQLARNMDATAKPASYNPYYYSEDAMSKELAKAQSVKADVSYMGSGAQTQTDCVLYAIANGAQVPVGKVKETFQRTIKDLGMDKLQDRQNPDLIIDNSKQGGGRGLNIFEELLVAERLGDPIAVPKSAFAQAIETTGKPVVTSVNMPDGQKHEVIVTGIYRTDNGRVYYSVMDSNFADQKNFTKFMEKAGFESSMSYGGGYVIVPYKKK